MYNRKDVYKRAFSLRFYLFIAVIFILLLIFYNCFSDQAWFLWIFAIISSVIGALLVGVYYDFIQKEEISNEHLKIMEYLNENKNSSGIIKYYPSFEDSINDIRNAVIDNNNNELDIYLTYGYTILNNLRNDINYMLSRENTVVNIYLMGKKNPFIDAYSKFWYGDGLAKLEQKLDQSIQELKDNFKDLNNRNALIGELKVFINNVSPVNYSFYQFEEELFFVPSKNIETKGFSPITIRAQRTSVKDSLYNKVATELNRMRDEDYFEKMELNEEK